MITLEKMEEHRKKMVNSEGRFSLSDRYKLLKMIDKYLEQENESFEEDIKKVQYIFAYYCMGGVKSEAVDVVSHLNYKQEENIKIRKEIKNKEFIQTYKNLMLTDKKRKTALWSERNVYIFNFFEEGRQFLNENKYSISKLEPISWSFLSKNTISLDTILAGQEQETINQIKKLFPTYLKKIDWGKQQMDSHLVVLLAIDAGYELNQKQINEYFPVVTKKYNYDMSKQVDYFAYILSHSNFFINNVTQWKVIKNELGKNFNIPMNHISNNLSMTNFQTEESNLLLPEKFIFMLAEHPLLKHNNLQNKMEKREKTTIFGKPYLNKEEEDKYIHYKEKKTQMTKVKKIKI